MVLDAGRLREVYNKCESLPLIFCGFCSMPIHSGRFCKFSDLVRECMDCREQMRLPLKDRSWGI